MRQALFRLSRQHQGFHLSSIQAHTYFRTCATDTLSNKNGTPTIRLRTYQEECIQAVLAHIDQGHKRLGVSLATGSGKTVIFTHLIDRVKSIGEATRTLILVHRRELVEQAARHCQNVYPDKSVEIEMRNFHATGTADITIASVQSIAGRYGQNDTRLSKYRPDTFKLVLVDEAHHIVASTYLEVLKHFNLSETQQSSDSPALVGVSATFSRFDGLRLGAAIDRIVYHRDYVDMIGEKWLSNVVFTTVKSKADTSKVRSNAHGDFQSKQLSKAVNTSQTNDLTVRAWLERASTRHSTLVFCVDVEHIVGLANTFRNHGIQAEYVTGATPKALRGRLLDDFRDKKFPVLINCGVFTEGTDIPNIDCVLLARPTRSRNLLVQMIGRGMRLFPGKENCHIIDMVASLDTGIITTPSLFGLDPSELLDETNIEKMQALKETRRSEEAIQEQSQTPDKVESGLEHRREDLGVTFTDYDSIFDLLEDSSGERHIRGLSSFAWVGVGQGRYVLTTDKEGTYLTLEQKSETNWVVKETPRMEAWLRSKVSSPFRTPRELAKAKTFPDAVHAADTYAKEMGVWTLLSRNQPWRKAPATEGQLNFLNRKVTQESDKLKAEDVTKGKAADMITKIKHGASGHFRKIQQRQRQVQRDVDKKERAAELQRRETVEVGPLSQG